MELDNEKAEELLKRGYESPDLDYKERFDGSTGSWMELAKDVYGMANYGGGYIVLGVKDGTFEPVGLEESFHLDTQIWIEKFSKWTADRINLSYLEYVTKINGTERKFPILYVHGSVASFVIPKDDGKYAPNNVDVFAFRKGVIYTRQNTSTVAATGGEFWKLFWGLLRRTAERTGAQSVPLDVINALNKKVNPDNVEETLWFNLFPVTEIPDLIYSADSDFRDAKKIHEKINSQTQTSEKVFHTTPPFLLADKKIYSFSPFDEDNPLAICISSIDRPIHTKEWLTDIKKQQKLIMLLNYNLKDLCWKRGFFYDRKRDRYFTRYFGDPVREITWKPYKSTSTRSLVNLKVKDGKLIYCEHFGARMRFIVLGGGIYLIIEPIRVLTEDGVNPLDQKMNVRISTKKNVFYHNNNYLYDVKLWLHILAGNRQEIYLGEGENKIVVSVLSINSRVNFGILDDQHTNEDFLDSLKSEPLEYLISHEDMDDSNPLTETSMEE